MGRNWVRAMTVEALEAKSCSVFRHRGRQVALFRTTAGVVACNNRCPHQGYPLSEGHLDDACVLTCNWHNWKFDLRDGTNLYGGDRLRVYPTEVRDGEVWLDLTDPSPEQQHSEAMRQLRDAFDRHDYERLAREIGRLSHIGADPLDALRAAICWSFDKLEFGWTHAFAGASDWLVLYEEHDGESEIQLACLLESLGHIAFDVLREKTYPFASGWEIYDEAGFLRAIEAEDEPTAVAMIRDACARGLTVGDLEGALTRAALAHYNDFGHSLIYVSKIRFLVDRLGATVQEPLLLALTRSLVFATREDLIPEFRAYLGALASRASAAGAPDMAAFRKLGVVKSVEKVADVSAAHYDAAFEALLGANAVNMLAFDGDYQYHIDRPISDNVGWLDFTHGITFANAVRKQCTRYPDTWRAGLLQLACFSGRNAAFTTRKLELERWRVNDGAAFLAEALEVLFDHGRDEYIVSVHVLKTLLAVREEFRRAEKLDSGETESPVMLLAALNRFLHEPLKRKHVRRTVRQAMRFVALD